MPFGSVPSSSFNIAEHVASVGLAMTIPPHLADIKESNEKFETRLESL